MISLNKSLVAMLAGLIASAQLAFGIINAPVPTNAYITIGGLDWAWANPVPYDSPPSADGGYGVTMDLTYQAQFGWHIPTAAELAFAPLATDFLVPGGNVPFGLSDPVSGAIFQAINDAYSNARSAGAVAVPYFSLAMTWADWQDGLGQGESVWAGMAGAPPYADQLVVRESVTGVPETTSTLGLLGLALGFVVMLRRRFCR